MFFKYFIIITILQKIRCELIFEEYFNELNRTKWVILDRKADCEKLNPRKIICDTSNEINLRTISGTLAITAVSQAYFDRKFTSATIITKRTFKFDGFNYLFRIRAALTKGPGLLPHVFLILDQDYKRRTFTSFYTIISRSNNKIWDGNSLVDIAQTPMNKTDFDQFQNYDLIISKESRLIWRVNDQVYLDSSSNRGLWENIFKFPFRLGITLDLDSYYSEQQLDELSISHWNCSTFIVDSVHIYENETKQEISEKKMFTKDKNISEICENITLLESSAKISPGLIKSLNLLWSDEFDDNSKKSNNWIVESSVNESSVRNDMKNCSFHKTSNIEISNGTLKLYPMGKNINSPGEFSMNPTGLVIASIPCFKNVRVEIRAKRPKGVELTARIYMQAYQDHCNSEIVTGLLDIAKIRDPDEQAWNFNAQETIFLSSKRAYQKLLRWGLSKSFYENNFFISTINLNSNLQHSYYHSTLDNLDEFQNYGIEWNEIGIQWLFNDHVIYQANPKMDQFGRSIIENNDNGYNFYLPFKHPFNLLIEIFARDYDEESDSPAFEIDYVRVYGNQQIGSEIIDTRVSKKQLEPVANITENIIKGPPYPLIGVSLLVFILVILLAISLVLSFVKIRNIRKKNEQLQNSFKQEEVYDDVINIENEYSQPYSNPLYLNLYEDISIDTYDKIDNGYIEMRGEIEKNSG